MDYKFDYDRYRKRVSTIFNDKRGNILSKALKNSTLTNQPKSALCANILMGTSQLGTNGQSGFNQITNQCLNFPLDHYLHCNVGVEWYFITGSLKCDGLAQAGGIKDGTFLIVFLYHQLLPQKYCSTSFETPHIYNMGQGRILEIIVSIVINGKRYYDSKLKFLNGDDILQNMIGPFNLPGVSVGNDELATFISIDNSLKKIHINANIINKTNTIHFSLDLTMNSQGPITNTYNAKGSYMVYSWGPMEGRWSISGILDNKKHISGNSIVVMDHQWGTLGNTNITAQLLNLLGVIRVSPLNLGWGLTTKEIAIAIILDKQSTFKCFNKKNCNIYLSGATVFLGKPQFPVEIKLNGVIPTSEKIQAIFDLNVTKSIQLGSTWYPLYLQAKLKSVTTPFKTSPMALPGAIPNIINIVPVIHEQRVFWQSGGEAYEGGTILNDKNGKSIGIGFLECTGWLDWRTFTSQVLKNVDIPQTTENITLFSTRSLAQPIILLIFSLLFFSFILISLFWSITFHIKKKQIYYPFKNLIISLIISGLIVAILLVGGGAFN